MNADFKSPRPGYAFKNGKFYEFSAGRIVVMRAWPEPMVWFRTLKQPWKGTRKFGDYTLLECFRSMASPCHRPAPLDQYTLSRFQVDEMKANGATPAEIEAKRVFWWKLTETCWKNEVACIQPFIAQIPPEIRTIIAPLRYRAWHMLTLFARCPGALDLYHSNPALAFALSGHWLYREQKVRNPLRAARTLVYKRQREILHWMGFPGTKSVQRIFQKIAVTTLHPAALRSMKATLLDPERLKVLTHLPVITPEVLSLVMHEEDFRRVSMRFLLEMLEDQDGARRCRRLLRDTLCMDRQRGGGHAPACFYSVRRMREVHADLVTLTNDALLAKDMTFPDPPYAGNQDIQPIRTLRDLVSEGIQMRHCVASYADRVDGGCYYVYRVLKPVRATLGVSWYNDRWHCDQLQGDRNSFVGYDHRERIIESFFAKTCLRGPLQKAPEPDEEDTAPDIPDVPVPFDASIPLHPWVPCDCNGHPILLFSNESRVAADRIREVFAGENVA